MGFVKCCHSASDSWVFDAEGYALEYFVRMYAVVDVVDVESDMVVPERGRSSANTRPMYAIKI